MPKITRREFIKTSTAVLAGILTQQVLPVWGKGKSFTPFKFAFVPDAHLSTVKFDTHILLNESLIILQEVVNQLNAMNLDFVVFGGDLIDNHTKDYRDLSMFLDVIYPLNAHYYVIFGNKESDIVYPYTKEHFTAELRRFGFSEPNQTYWVQQPVNGVELIGLDSSVLNKRYGEIPQEQLDWLEGILSTSNNNFRIVNVHHSVLPVDVDAKIKFTKDYTLINKDALIKLIASKGNVDLVLSGHNHLSFYASSNGVNYVNCPSITTYPCCFSVFEVGMDGVKVRNVPINFKQIIKKGKEQLLTSEYAKQFGCNPKDVLQLHELKSREFKLV